MVHLWWGNIGALEKSGVVEELHDCLSLEEQVTCQKLLALEDQRHALTTRLVMRAVLSIYTAVHPHKLPLVRSESGKPALKGSLSTTAFNLSHTRDNIVIAVSENVKLGVDIEHIEPHRNIEAIAHRYFHPEEIRTLLSCARPHRAYMFYQLWTLKEGYIKARGSTLGASLASTHFRASGKNQYQMVDPGKTFQNATCKHQLITNRKNVCGAVVTLANKTQDSRPLQLIEHRLTPESVSHQWRR